MGWGLKKAFVIEYSLYDSYHVLSITNKKNEKLGLGYFFKDFINKKHEDKKTQKYKISNSKIQK